jgi:hypothetical protein
MRSGSRGPQSGHSSLIRCELDPGESAADYWTINRYIINFQSNHLAERSRFIVRETHVWSGFVNDGWGDEAPSNHNGPWGAWKL